MSSIPFFPQTRLGPPPPSIGEVAAPIFSRLGIGSKPALVVNNRPATLSDDVDALLEEIDEQLAEESAAKAAAERRDDLVPEDDR